MKTLGLTLLVAAYAVIPSLLYFRVVGYGWRFHLLVTTALVLGAIAVRVHGFRALGIRIDNWRTALLWNGVASLALAAGVVVAYALNFAGRSSTPQSPWFYVFYVLISSPAQELLYRAIIYAELEARGVTNMLVKLLFLSVPFALMHAFYRDWVVLVFAMAAGLAWGLIYVKAPNLIFVSASHAIFGMATILMGMI